MTDSGQRCQHKQFFRLDTAFHQGDMAALRREIGSIEGFPNIVAHPAMGLCLTYAIYHSPLPFIKALLEAGADPRKYQEDGFPPLIAALTTAVPNPGASVRNDVLQLLQMLLTFGADVAERGINDATPLHVAAAQGNLDAVNLLLANGADPNAITRIDDMITPLEAAVTSGHQGVVQRLKPLTLRPNWEQASRDGNIVALKRLLAGGYDINARDGYGQTALMHAAHAGKYDTVAWLIKQGADLDCTAKFHLSALMLAVVSGHQRIARLLMTAGADTTIRGTGAPGFDGKTAAELAEVRRDITLARFLRQRHL